MRGKHIQPHAGQCHDAHAHGGAQPCKALCHVPAVCAHSLSHQRKSGVLNAVACHVAQALGADPQTVGGSAQPGHDAHQQHLCRGQGGALCCQRCAHLPHVVQTGAGNVPRAGLADAQRAVPQQQNTQRQRTAHSVGKRRAQCCTRYAPAQTPDREVLAEYRHFPSGVDEEKVEDDVQYAGEDADEARGKRITRRAQHGGIGAHGHDEGQGSRPDGKIGRSVCLQCRVCAQPPGQKPADAHAKGRCRQTHRQIEQHGLPQNATGVLLAVCAQILCHLNGKRHAQPGQHPVQQPCAGTDDANGGCCGGADMPHHGGINVLHGGDHDLLQNGRDAQRQRHLCGVAQRHLLALPHPGRELLKCNGHGTSCVVGENYRLIHYYRELREKSQSKVNFAAGIDFWSRA